MKFLSIHVTDLCNSCCDFCVVASPLYTKDSIQYDSIVEFIKANARKGFAAVNLHGGEATIHPKFFEILELVREYGYPEVHLQTNGIKLADASFATRTTDLGVSKFIISLHGDRPDIQDSQTGTPGGFRRTVEGIRNVKANRAYVRTNTVITRLNLGRLTEICKLACDLGVDHINLSNLHPVGSALFSRSSGMPSFDEMREEVYRSVDLVASYGRTITLEGFPYCTVKERIQYQLNNEEREIRMLMRGSVIENYDRFMSDVMRVFGEACVDCAAREKCGGVYPQYTDYYGWREFVPLEPALAHIACGELKPPAVTS